MIQSNSKKSSKPLMKMIKKEIDSPSKNYKIRPQSIFRSPLSHIISDEFRDRDQRKMEITTHCNYGFNYDTIKVYASILDRMTTAYNLKEIQKMYNCEESGLFRLNDGIPLQFGGFSPCLNPNLLNISPADDFQNGNSLFQYFIEICFNINPLTSYPLNEFIKNIYKEGDLKTITEVISGNIEDFLNESIKDIRQNNQRLGIEEEKTGFGPENEENEEVFNFYQILFAELAISEKRKQQQAIIEEKSSIIPQTIEEEPFGIGKRTRSESQMEDEDQPMARIFKDDNRIDHFISVIKVKEENKMVDENKQKKKEKRQARSDSESEQTPKKKKDRKKDKKRKIKKDKHKKREKEHQNKKNKHKKEKSKHRRFKQ